MEIKSFENKRYLSSPMLDGLGFVSHLFSTRDFGNQGLHVGDIESDVLANRENLSRVLGINWKNLVSGKQIHGTKVIRVGNFDLGKGASSYEDGIEACDGLITDIPGVPLFAFYADCTPIFLADPVKKVIGILHAGWKGTLADMAGKGVERFVEEFGSRPEDIKAVIAPRIGVECYQVSKEMVVLAKNLGLGDFPHVQDDHLNLASINEALLKRRGVSDVEVDLLCTSCNLDLFYSHRVEKAYSGRMAAIIMIKGDEEYE